MKHLILSIITAVAMFAFSDVASAQVTGSVTPNNVAQGGTVTVELSGLNPGDTVNVIFSGNDGSVNRANAAHNVVVGANGKASWTETVGWPPETYTTNVSWRIGQGQPNNTQTGTLNVTP